MTCLDETRHGLEDGDFVTFSEVKGMEGLNGCEPRKITVKGPYTFSIGSTIGQGSYVSGGLFTQVKMPKVLHFVSIQPSFSPAPYADDAEIAEGVSCYARVLYHRFRQVGSPNDPPCRLPSALRLLRKEWTASPPSERFRRIRYHLIGERNPHCLGWRRRS